MKITDSQQTAIKSGFIVLIAFAILRPLSLMGEENLAIGAVEITELMGVGISYLLILPLMAGLRKIRFDLFSLLIMTFIFYSAESIIWGSEFRKIAQTILPFIVFFSVRTFLSETKQIRLILIFLVLGYLIPITLSSYDIMVGKSVQTIEFHTGFPRFAGAFTGIHTLSYSMLFFSFLYCILNYIYNFKNILSRLIFFLFLILSAYCLYKSLTRTVMFGFIIFWLIYLWGTNKKAFFIGIVIFSLVSIIFYDHIHSIIFKTEEINLNIATSGRITLLVNNIRLFSESSFTQKLFGHGLGHEHRYMFHNDYIGLLMNLGLVGLFLYLIMLFFLFKDIFACTDRKTKYLFGAILISVVIMNFGSNAVIFRFELSQYFWLIMGLFYVIIWNKDLNKREQGKNY